MVQLEGLLWASEEPTNEDFNIESKHVELCLMCAWYVHVYTSVYVHCIAKCIHGLHSCCMCMCKQCKGSNVKIRGQEHTVDLCVATNYTCA